MTDRSRRRDRYLRDPLPVRLGGLAANLARAQSFADNPAHGDAVAQLLEESAWFIEWAAPDAPIAIQMALVSCQRDIARWRRVWTGIWRDPSQRMQVAEQAGVWSQRFLSASGLVSVETTGKAAARPDSAAH
jgi:hypothetical protein